MNDNGVEITSDGPKAASMLNGKFAATSRERMSGVKNKNAAVNDNTADILPPLVVDHPGANGSKDKTAKACPHSVAMIEIIHR